MCGHMSMDAVNGKVTIESAGLKGSVKAGGRCLMGGNRFLLSGVSTEGNTFNIIPRRTSKTVVANGF